MDTKLNSELLKELEGKLKDLLLQIPKQIEDLKKDDPFSDPDHASDNAAVDTDVREQVGHDTIEAEIKDLQKKLDDVHHALNKMSKGKYGLCEKCGKPILKARLMILPEARYCVADEQKLRK